MDGFQFLENNFFSLCRTRKIYKIPQLLFIYLRGLYYYFGKPTFFWKDEKIMKHLGISRNTLRMARERLKERGAIDYFTFAGRGKAVRYLILRTDLAPEIKRSKFHPFFKLSTKGSKTEQKGSEFHPFPEHEKGQNLTLNNKDIENKPLESTVHNLLKKTLKQNERL